MLTKAIIQSIDYTKNMCKVRIPLFENASRNVNMIEADAQINIVPGIYNSYKTGDVVFISFEEDKMELPVILGKLFVSASTEAGSYRGNVSGNSLAITDTAQLPYSTVFNYDKVAQNKALYTNLNTPKKLADSIIKLQQSQPQVQRYQTVIRVLATTSSQDTDKQTCNLYLKTFNDFTYTSGTSDEPLCGLFTALKNSQTADVYIPLDCIVFGNNTISQALLRVSTVDPTELSFEVLVGSDSLVVTKADIQSVKSTAIYY